MLAIDRKIPSVLKSMVLIFTPAMIFLVLPAHSYSDSFPASASMPASVPVSVNSELSASLKVPDKNRQMELTYLVQQDCGSCHGMRLKGGLGPSLLPERIKVLPKQYLIDTLTHGRPNTPMPPWGPLLTSGEIKWIVEQLQLGQIGQITPNQTQSPKLNQPK